MHTFLGVSYIIWENKDLFGKINDLLELTAGHASQGIPQALPAPQQHKFLGTLVPIKLEHSPPCVSPLGVSATLL